MQARLADRNFRISITSAILFFLIGGAVASCSSKPTWMGQCDRNFSESELSPHLEQMLRQFVQPRWSAKPEIEDTLEECFVAYTQFRESPWRCWG